mgnify:CR=1 FL=1
MGARDEPSTRQSALSNPLTAPPAYEDDDDAFAPCKSLYASGSTAELPILPPSSSSPRTAFPPSRRSPPRAPSSASSRLDHPFHIRRWHLSLLFFAILLPLLAPLLHVFLPTTISTFLDRTTSLAARDSPPRAVGDLYWSLFGRDDTCCAYVPHGDGYTLHYPSSPGQGGDEAGKGSGDAVTRLTRHAWEVRGERPYWLEEGKELRDVKGWRDLPVVNCPQKGVTLANGTLVGGSGAM